MKTRQVLDADLVGYLENALHGAVANPVLTEIRFIRGDPFDLVRACAAAGHVEAAKIEERAVGRESLVGEWSTRVRSPTRELANRCDSLHGAQRLAFRAPLDIAV